MTTDQAISFYKTQEGLATVLGIRQSSVSEWGEYPPAFRQVQIERLTRGQLRAEATIFERKKRKIA